MSLLPGIVVACHEAPMAEAGIFSADCEPQVLSLAFLGARREAGVTMKNHVTVRADTLAGVGATAASASLAEYLMRAMKYSQTSSGAVPFLELWRGHGSC